eukprot:1213493-Pleurochrysis_carterae.AAC.1
MARARRREAASTSADIGARTLSVALPRATSLAHAHQSICLGLAARTIRLAPRKGRGRTGAREQA